MTEQRVLTESLTRQEQGEVWVSQALFEQLGEMTRTNRQAVSVMLMLIANIGANGTVQFTQAAVAQQYKISLKEVAKAIADLESAGLIGSVHASSELGGALACVVNADLARAEKPDEISPLSVAEGA